MPARTHATHSRPRPHRLPGLRPPGRLPAHLNQEFNHDQNNQDLPASPNTGRPENEKFFGKQPSLSPNTTKSATGGRVRSRPYDRPRGWGRSSAPTQGAGQCSNAAASQPGGASTGLQRALTPSAIHTLYGVPICGSGSG